VCDVLRLFGRIEFESAGTNGLTGLHGDGDRGRQRRLPREEVLPLDRIVLLDARASDGLPDASIQAERPSELILIAPWGIVQHRGSVGGSTAERMGERLVLRSHGGDGVRRREVRALEVGGCKVGDAVADGGGELGDGLLNLGGVVVGLGLVRLGDPGCERVRYEGYARAAASLEQREMGLTQRVDAGLEVFVLCFER
jgi:hypothetical protein